jgi:hypothetical protein
MGATIGYGADKVGVDNALIASAVTGSWIAISGHRQLTLELILTWAAAGNVVFYLQTCSADAPSDAQASYVQMIDTDGETYVRRPFRHAVSGNDSWTVNVGVNTRWVRLIGVEGAGATTDRLSVRAMVGEAD